MRTMLILTALGAIAIAACDHDGTPARSPAGQTQTTSGAYSTGAPASQGPGNPDMTGAVPSRGDLRGYGTPGGTTMGGSTVIDTPTYGGAGSGPGGLDDSNVGSPSNASGAIDTTRPPKGVGAPGGDGGV